MAIQTPVKSVYAVIDDEPECVKDTVKRVTFAMPGASLCPLDRLFGSTDALAIDFLATADIESLRTRPLNIKRILRCADWPTASLCRMEAFCSFVEVLVSDQPLSLPSAASSLFSCLALLDPSTPQSRRIHKLLQHINELVPSSSTVLAPIFSEFFPHKSEGLSNHLFYLSHALEITKHTPILEEHILTLVVDRLLKIDVEIDELDENDEDDAYSKKIDENGDSVDDDSDDEVNAEGEEDEDLDSDFEQAVSVNIKLMVEKLDTMMDLVLAHITTVKDSGNSECLSALFQTLLYIFEKLVVHTHKSKYTQFIVFYICSFDKSFSDDFLGMFMNCSFNNQGALMTIAYKSAEINTPNVVRASAVSYIGSYMARASYFNTQPIRTGIHYMVDWALKYIKDKTGQVDKRVKKRYDPYPSKKQKETLLISPREHTLFYTTVQSILYLFCFRWKVLLTNAEGTLVHGSFPIELAGLDRIINSKFQPLKVCSPSIVEEFAKLTRSLEIVYCYVGKGVSDVTLDVFFPFDPLPLKRTGAYIDSLFQQWESCEVADQDDLDG